MYRSYEEEEAEWNYKAVCILLAVIFIINVAVSVWQVCQINKLQLQWDKTEAIQENYENSTENTKNYIEALVDELNEIKIEAADMFFDILVSALGGILVTMLTLIPIELLKHIFKSVRDSRHYSSTIEKIIIIETICVGASFISEICTTLSNISTYRDLFKLYEDIFSTLNLALLMTPSF